MADKESGKFQVSLPGARGVVVGDRNVVVQNVTAGLAALATHYAIRQAGQTSSWPQFGPS
ncbi:hypothetical protein FB388_1282 [Pseudonocardia cypriaca]|uniref:Uncharacterized protein n=1 Tax=Pseudonocardia cypriaca TaxID=882449 RepID=A0A543GD05_9PSEU|nr:hypothetical protein FB388_1282 [Pseudonocardia cypriaca]